MEILRSPGMVREALMKPRMRGRSIGLVPTMGALHNGHMSLVKTSLMENDITVASIFVNPTQFAEGEDLEKYPSDLESDDSKLRQAGVDILFMPSAKDMYGEGFDTFVDVGPIGTRLCGAYRPTHFRGVATVVTKLFNIVTPIRSYFGQKDYQQCRILINMARDLNLPVEVVMCPTLRAPDGFALSSRNIYLSEKERAAAPVLYNALKEGARLLKEEGATAEAVNSKMQSILKDEPLVSQVQYIGCYDPQNLKWLEQFSGKALLAGAIKIGSTRLIDNIVL